MGGGIRLLPNTLSWPGKGKLYLRFTIAVVAVAMLPFKIFTPAANVHSWQYFNCPSVNTTKITKMTIFSS